jgi:hypothetical protein
MCGSRRGSFLGTSIGAEIRAYPPGQDGSGGPPGGWWCALPAEGDGITASSPINLFRRFMRLGLLKAGAGRLGRLLIGAGKGEVPVLMVNPLP